MDRRNFVKAAAAALGSLALWGCGRGAGAQAGERFEIMKSDAEWRAILSPEAYAVLRLDRTELPGSSPLDGEHRHGTFLCGGCGLPLFSSAAKFDSGTGWPSFSSPLPGATATKEEFGLLGAQTEVHCRRCGGHLGHVFDDGPAPTGKRYCMNGAALRFVTA
jgi:peptide-methionine (R)-S-oxide reductase